MRFFRFVIILLSGFLHYHIYHHLVFLCQPIRPHPRLLEYHYHLCGSSPYREPPDSSRLCAAALRTEFVPDV